MGQLTLGEQAAPSTPTAGNTLYSTVATPSILRVKDDAGVDSPIAIVLTGTWTPTLVGTSTPGTHTYTTQVGRYIRLGNWVAAALNITINVKDGTMAGNVRVGGLPFTVRTGDAVYSNTYLFASLATSIVNPIIQVASNTTQAFLYRNTAAAASIATLVAADIQNGSLIGATLIYETT